MGIYTESLALLLITKLSHHSMILGHPGMKKYRVLLNMINNSIIFSSKYCIHPGALLFLVFIMPEKNIEIISIAIY